MKYNIYKFTHFSNFYTDKSQNRGEIVRKLDCDGLRLIFNEYLETISDNKWPNQTKDEIKWKNNKIIDLSLLFKFTLFMQKHEKSKKLEKNVYLL